MAKTDDDNLQDLDLYDLLDVQITSTEAEIKKAYRRKALECHPDKNPDNPNAAKEFQRLSKILAILTDAAARTAYDRVLKGRKEAALRHRELDSKRRKLKEDLEERERQASSTYKKKSADEQLKDEIERLRKEGSKQVEEELEFIAQQLREELNKKSEQWDSSQYRIKITWKAAKDDETNGGYNQTNLHQILAKYGDVAALVVSKKKGSGLVEFKTKNAAEMAVELETGLMKNPLKLEWLNEPPKSSKPSSSLVKESDFESLVLTKMRQAEERKRLIEQMMAEDASETN